MYNSEDILITDSIFDDGSKNVIYSRNPVEVDSTWFGSIIPGFVPSINAVMSHILFLNCSYEPSKFEVGSKLNMHFDLYSYGSYSGKVSKYKNDLIQDILDLGLVSNDGLLSKNSVKLGEEFTFTPYDNSSGIEVHIGKNVNTFDFIVFNGGSADGSNQSHDDSSNYPSSNDPDDSLTDYLSDYYSLFDVNDDYRMVRDRNITNHSSKSPAKANNPQSGIGENNLLWVVLLILVVVAAGGLIKKYKN